MQNFLAHVCFRTVGYLKIRCFFCFCSVLSSRLCRLRHTWMQQLHLNCVFNKLCKLFICDPRTFKHILAICFRFSKDVESESCFGFKSSPTSNFLLFVWSGVRDDSLLTTQLVALAVDRAISPQSLLWTILTLLIIGHHLKP